MESRETKHASRQTGLNALAELHGPGARAEPKKHGDFPLQRENKKWTNGDSNARLFACKANTLPAELYLVLSPF